MKKGKDVSLLMICCLFAMVLIGGQQAYSAVEIRYAHVGVEGETQTRFADEFAALVEEKTEGRVVFKVFPNSQLGNISEMVDGVKTGIIDMAHHDFASVGKLLPDMAVFNAPFIYKDAEHAVKAGNSKTSPILPELNERLVEKAGMRVLGSFYRGARQLTANFPVYSPADLKGKKIRGVPLKIWMSMLEGMGAIPTPVEFPELATALMTGIVVGQENPLNNIYSAKLYEVQTHVMMTSHMQSILCVFVNEKLWQSIPENDRVLIEEALEEVAYRSLEWDQEAVGELKEKLKAEGMTFIEEKDGLDLQAFRDAVIPKVKEDFPEWIEYIDKIQAME